MLKRRDIEIHDSAFDPDLPRSGQKIRYRKEGQKAAHYRVFLYADGRDLPYVSSVTYHLHKTFPNPTRVVRRTPSNPRCTLKLWTWGLFDVRAVIKDKQGDEYEVFHRLSYDREIGNLPAGDYELVKSDRGSSPRGRVRGEN